MRNLIYGYYLGPRRSFEEIEAGRDDESVAHHDDWDPHSIAANIDERNLVKEPIIQVSRQIRLEALPLLIQNTCFSAQLPQTFDFLGSFGVAHVTTVRYIDSCSGGGRDMRMLRAIVDCPNLQHLELRLHLGYHEESTDDANGIEKVMRRPRMLETMKLRGLKEMVFEPVVRCFRHVHRYSFTVYHPTRLLEMVKEIVEKNAVLPKSGV